MFIRIAFAFYTTFMSFVSRPNAYNLLSILSLQMIRRVNWHCLKYFKLVDIFRYRNIKMTLVIRYSMNGCMQNIKFFLALHTKNMIEISFDQEHCKRNKRWKVSKPFSSSFVAFISNQFIWQFFTSECHIVLFYIYYKMLILKHRLQ